MVDNMPATPPLKVWLLAWLTIVMPMALTASPISSGANHAVHRACEMSEIDQAGLHISEADICAPDPVNELLEACLIAVEGLRQVKVTHCRHSE